MDHLCPTAAFPRSFHETHNVPHLITIRRVPHILVHTCSPSSTGHDRVPLRAVRSAHILAMRAGRRRFRHTHARRHQAPASAPGQQSPARAMRATFSLRRAIPERSYEHAGGVPPLAKRGPHGYWARATRHHTHTYTSSRVLARAKLPTHPVVSMSYQHSTVGVGWAAAGAATAVPGAPSPAGTTGGSLWAVVASASDASPAPAVAASGAASGALATFL